MLYKTLKNGFTLPVLGIGTWKIGGGFESDYTKDSEGIEEIQNGIESGITLIDTAELYGNGHTEKLLGEAIKGYDRKNLIIASKVNKTRLKHNDVLEACEKSLERLGTSYLDLYLIHFPNFTDASIEETMSAMNTLVEQGMVRNIGVCNFSKETLEKAQSVSKAKIVLNQCHYNLIFREPDVSGLLDYCRETDVILQAWRPLNYGLFAIEDNEILNKICVKYNKTPIQIALNWVISQDHVTALVKMGKKKHITENLEALDFTLDKEDIEYLQKNYPGQQSISDRVPLG